jgi:hypothetical protein
MAYNFDIGMTDEELDELLKHFDDCTMVEEAPVLFPDLIPEDVRLDPNTWEKLVELAPMMGSG